MTSGRFHASETCPWGRHWGGGEFASLPGWHSCSSKTKREAESLAEIFGIYPISTEELPTETLSLPASGRMFWKPADRGLKGLATSLGSGAPRYGRSARCPLSRWIQFSRSVVRRGVA